jgi:hypothetical protein
LAAVDQAGFARTVAELHRPVRAPPTVA